MYGKYRRPERHTQDIYIYIYTNIWQWVRDPPAIMHRCHNVSVYTYMIYIYRYILYIIYIYILYIYNNIWQWVRYPPAIKHRCHNVCIYIYVIGGHIQGKSCKGLTPIIVEQRLASVGPTHKERLWHCNEKCKTDTCKYWYLLGPPWLQSLTLNHDSRAARRRRRVTDIYSHRCVCMRLRRGCL